jgi:hypothetical protein
VTTLSWVRASGSSTPPWRRFPQPSELAGRADARNGDVLQIEIESTFLRLFLKLPILQELVVRQRRHPCEDADVRRLATDR